MNLRGAEEAARLAEEAKAEAERARKAAAAKVAQAREAARQAQMAQEQQIKATPLNKPTRKLAEMFVKAPEPAEQSKALLDLMRPTMKIKKVAPPPRTRCHPSLHTFSNHNPILHNPAPHKPSRHTLSPHSPSPAHSNSAPPSQHIPIAIPPAAPRSRTSLSRTKE